jgi:outer membrane autotransporter protein
VGVGNGWLLGAALGSQQGEADIDAAGGGFDSAGLAGSLFAGYRCGAWFADAVLSAGRSELDDIERVFDIGRVQRRRESGDTDADMLGLQATLGVNLLGEAAAWRAGPFVALDALEIDVDAWAERGLSSSTMRFDDIARDSLLGTAGVFASYPFILGGAEVELAADVAYAGEFEDESDDVRAVVKSLDTGPWFRMPGYAIDDDGWRATLGANASWPGGMRLGLSYRHADNDYETRYLNLSAAYRF